MELSYVALRIPGEFACRDGPLALAAFLVRALDAQLHRPEGPGREWGAFLGRLRHQLELMYRQRFLAMRRAQAIRARIAAADDDHALAGGEDRAFIGHDVAFAA